MDPFEHGFVQTNGIRMHYATLGEGPPVLLLHGFPELWYSWRHQMRALAGAGYRAIAPDLRGYGQTDAPEGVQSYDLPHLLGDLDGLQDALGIRSCPVIAHDWGALLVWPWALLRPERVHAVASLNVAYQGRSPEPPMKFFSRTSRFAYVVYFQKPGWAERKIEADIPQGIGGMYRAQAADPAFMSEADAQVFYDAFSARGLAGPINYYRNLDRNWELTPQLTGRQVTQPSLLILASADKILTPEMARGMEAHVPDLRVHTLECGHWTQQERPEEVSALLINFLASLKPWT